MKTGYYFGEFMPIQEGEEVCGEIIIAPEEVVEALVIPELYY